MTTADIERLCDDVARAVEQVRKGFRSKLDTPEVLDRFWCLQDQVNRLVESASDCPSQTFDVIKETHPRLIRNILDVLNFAEKTQFSSAPAITTSVLRIDRSLAKLEFLREQDKAMVASA